MIKRFYFLLGAMSIFVMSGVAVCTQVASAASDPGSCNYFSSSQENPLGNTNWAGSVTFTSGPNTGIVEQGNFSYYANHTLYETTDGPAGNYTGKGVWGQEGSQFCDAFVEPFPGTTNVYVFIKEHGTIATDGQSYVGYGHGQLYQCSNNQCTAIPGADGDTTSVMARQS